MANVLPDENGEFGARVRTRLRDEQLIWLTTIGGDGTPQPNPVWFLWDGADSLIVYNRSGARRLDHVATNPRVSLNLNSNDHGGDVIVLAGHAELVSDVVAPDVHEGYIAKYGQAMQRVSGSAAEFAAQYPIPLRIRITKVRGH